MEVSCEAGNTDTHTQTHTAAATVAGGAEAGAGAGAAEGWLTATRVGKRKYNENSWF